MAVDTTDVVVPTAPDAPLVSFAVLLNFAHGVVTTTPPPVGPNSEYSLGSCVLRNVRHAPQTESYELPTQVWF